MKMGFGFGGFGGGFGSSNTFSMKKSMNSFAVDECEDALDGCEDSDDYEEEGCKGKKSAAFDSAFSSAFSDDDEGVDEECLASAFAADCDDDDDWCMAEAAGAPPPPPMAAAPMMMQSRSRRGPPPPRPPPKVGKANAARVSRGSMVDRLQKTVEVKAPKRDPSQHVTVTVVIYNTVAGGVPSSEDVQAAVADMDALYAACGWTGQLAEEGADFMKAELTVADALTIAEKVATQPYKPDSLAPENGDVFPTATPLQPLQANLLPETRDPSPPKKVKRTIFQRFLQAGKAIL